MPKLDGPQLKRLREILMQAFALNEFDLLIMQDRLNKSREQFALGNDYVQILAEVLRKANAYGWLNELVKAAREANPSDAELYAFAVERFYLGVVDTPPRDRLQRIISDTQTFLDIAQWREKLATIERHVCRISFSNGAKAKGTGFLIGNEAVLTNYHVMEAVIENRVAPAEVRVQFDFKVLPEGTIDNGTTISMANSWSIDVAKYSGWDKTGAGDLPTSEQLDYAVIRLERPLGDEPIGEATDPKARKRGFLDIRKTAATPAADAAIFIVQHPSGAPLKLALNTQSVIGLAAGGLRLQHRTNTEPGSSGSPTFNADWELLALHNTGDPDFSKDHAPQFNQGIPLKLIHDLLDKRGKLPEIYPTA